MVAVVEEGTAQEEVAQQIGIVDFGERIVVGLGLGLMDLREHQIVVGKRLVIGQPPIVVAVDLMPVKAQQIGIVVLLPAHCRRLLNPSPSTVGGNHQLGIVAVARVGPVGRVLENTIADRLVERTAAAVPYWNLCLGHNWKCAPTTPINPTWQQNEQ